MSDVKSKNLYELLGNTSDQDSDREPEPPTKAIEKPAARSGKRDAPKAAPVASADGNARGGANRRAGGFTGNEAAFRDRTTGRNFNREKQTEEGETGVRTGRDSGPGTRRAGRGPRGPRRGGDRHSRTGLAEHQKQTDQAWGGATGEGEWADEKAGDAIAKEEVKEDGFGTNVEAPVDGEGKTAVEEAEPEPEDNHKSYADYLAEQAAKKLEGLGLKEARQANEGSKENKKWASAKALSKEEDEAYFAGQEKARRERERTSKKEVLDIDYSFKEQPRDARGGARGGRGGRGGRGEFRGEFRGDRGGRGRGSFGGDRGDRGDRGRGRGGRGRGGADGATVALNDETAFPSLGA